MLTCSISGNVPEEPVISAKSGYIFEKKLVLSVIKQNGLCPVTDQPLTSEDLLPVQTEEVVQPRPPSAISISSLLRHLQDEWDANLIETYKLRKHVTQIRQELSHALYQHDAACRVIARVTQERDKARSELAETGANMAAALTQTNISIPEATKIIKTSGIDHKIKVKIIEKANEMQKWRKNRQKKPEGLATKEDIEIMKETASNTLHSPSQPGIFSVSLNPYNDQQIFTGGSDGQIINWNTETKKIDTILKGHKKKVLVLKCHADQPILLSGSADKTIGIWTQGLSQATWKLAGQVNYPKGPVNDIDIHPLGDYFVSGQDDQTWAFTNLTQGRVIQTVKVEDCKRITGCQIHPDGRLLCTGDDKGNVRIWELHNQKTLISLEKAHAPITSLSFSENGYHLASSSNDGMVRIYDLRKVNVLHSWKSRGSSMNVVQYDKSGQYLAMGGIDVRVYQTKSWEKPILSLKKHSKEVTDVCWSKNAKSLVSVSKDRFLKKYTIL